MSSRRRSVRMVIGALALAMPAVSNAAVIQWTGTSTGGDGSSWEDPLNWTDTTADPDQVGVLPGSSDNVQLGGATVHITSDVIIKQWHTTGGTGQVHIDDGGTLTGTHSYTTRYATIHVNDGAVFNALPTWGASRTSIHVNEGGLLNGLAGMGTANDSNTLTINGTVNVRGTSSSALMFSLGATTAGTIRWGKLNLNETGVMNLDVFGNNVNEFIEVGYHKDTLLKLDAGTINLLVQDEYVPQVGDTFDLWDIVADSEASLASIGDGSNIVLAGYGLDTSTFATDGVVTVASVMPEPASVTAIGLVGLLLCRRRRASGKAA